MLAVMGTSTCHVMNSDVLAEVPGMCGVVDGGITPGRYGYEAGQSAVGDIFAWYVEQCVPTAYHLQAQAQGVSVHELLSELAAGQQIGEHGLVALDWFGGNRSVLVDHTLAGVVLGQTLATTAPEVYRALFEATAFGTRTIIEASRPSSRLSTSSSAPAASWVYNRPACSARTSEANLANTDAPGSSTLLSRRNAVARSNRRSGPSDEVHARAARNVRSSR